MPAAIRKLAGDCATRAIIDALEAEGTVIVEDFVPSDWLARFNGEIGPAVEEYRRFVFDIDDMDDFLGAHTVRLHGLLNKAPSYLDLMLDARILAAADHFLLPRCSSYRLNAGELIEIRGGESAQPFHIDDDSWPKYAKQGAGLLDVNVMVAASDFTAANGATLVVPGSHRWKDQRQPKTDEIAQAVMRAGSAAFVRGDTLHAGGTNTSGDPRRAISTSYVLGWLRPVENSYLHLPLDLVRKLPKRARELLGYEIYDGSAEDTGILGYYEFGSPSALFR